jgi:hypothetical protein
LLLILKQGKHKQTIPLDPLTNTPSFRSASALHTYRAFVALHEAAEAQNYYQASEVVSKTILMGQPGLSFYVPVVRSIITLLIPYIILKKDVAIVLL